MAHLVIGDRSRSLRIEQPALASPSRRRCARRPAVKSSIATWSASRRVAQDRRLVDQVGQIGAGEARREAGDLCPDRHSAASWIFFMWTLRIATRPAGRAGRPGSAGRSGRRAAAPDRGSRAGWWPPAARCPSRGSKPSSSTSSWLRVCSFSSWPPKPTGRAARLAQRVELVDEDDAGRGLARLLEQVAHPCGADADEHLDELRAGDGEERHPGLAGHGPRQQRLAGAGRADQQDALGHVGAEAAVAVRVLEEGRRPPAAPPWPRRPRPRRRR